ncbi:MAG: prepilin-type N-terminal cleavage/methylation domain-containing protein [Planctomycetes bacterium]|nr:prepilin-type N-terminal cleavage/methylation domain-containing protein [Planctomycetota bacterium]
MRNVPSRPSGFTLLEVLIAMTVIMIGVSGISALFALGLGMGRQTSDITNASIIARSVRDALVVSMASLQRQLPAVNPPNRWATLVCDGVGIGRSSVGIAPVTGGMSAPQYPFPLPTRAGDRRHHPGNQNVYNLPLAQLSQNPPFPLPGDYPITPANTWVTPTFAANPFAAEVFRVGATPPYAAPSPVPERYINPVFWVIRDIRGADVQLPANLGAVPAPVDMTLDLGMFHFDFAVEGDPPPAQFSAALPRTYQFEIHVYRDAVPVGGWSKPGQFEAGQWNNVNRPPLFTYTFRLSASD